MSDDNTNITPLRVVDIKPPEYRDPVTMLRNLAREIEEGQHGDVRTIAIAIRADEAIDGLPLAIFGGGRESDITQTYFAFSTAQALLFQSFMEGAK